MFGLSIGEIIVIGAVALIVLGPDRIPGVARSLGKMMAELRRAVDEVKNQLSINDTFPPYNPPPPTKLIADILNTSEPFKETVSKTPVKESEVKKTNSDQRNDEERD